MGGLTQCGCGWEGLHNMSFGWGGLKNRSGWEGLQNMGVDERVYKT